jgi:hypothetical protein
MNPEEKNQINAGIEQFLENFLTEEEKVAQIAQRIEHHYKEIRMWEDAKRILNSKIHAKRMVKQAVAEAMEEEGVAEHV